MGSQLPSLVQNMLVPNDTALVSLVSGLNVSAVNSAENLFNSFISEDETKPEDVDKIIKLLKALIKEQDGYVVVHDNKIKAALENLNKVKKDSNAAIAGSDGKVAEAKKKLAEAKKANNKFKVNEAKKVAKAQQAHTDAKANKRSAMLNINHQKKVLQMVIEYLRPLSTQKTISYTQKWTKCVGNKEYGCKDYGVDSVCIGERYFQPWRKVSVLPEKKYTVTLDYFAINSWDGEYGQVFINNKLCWKRRIYGKRTEKDCGPWSHKHAQKFSVSCSTVGDSKGELTVKAASTLNERYPNECFGVANLKVHQA